MAKPQVDSSNWDKAGTRLWLTYEFWRPADFALNHGIAERTVRHMLTLGMPYHGQPHEGRGGIRLAKSAITWLQTYRLLTGDGAFRFPGMHAEFLDDLSIVVADERMAYWKLYGGAQPHDAELDEYLASREAASERRSWRTGFREIIRQQISAAGRS